MRYTFDRVFRETIQYKSSADATSPLLADVAFESNGKRKPLLLVMHGYAGGRGAVTLDIEELAPRGVVAVAPDMRGREGSAGTWDSGGLDVHDIVDAALDALRRYPGEIDPRNINIVGYSGGGGCAIAAGCRFPDLFNTSVSFFGIPDYGGWYRSNGRPDCNNVMRDAIGTPEQFPARFEARNMIPAAGNAKRTKWWLLWDSHETMCPASLVEDWITEAIAAGVHPASIKRSITTPAHAKRWVHNYRTGNRQLTAADDLFLPDVFVPPLPSGLALEKEGELVVPGYLVSRRFSVFVSDGTQGRVRIRYNITGRKARVDVIDNPRDLPVKIEHDTPIASLLT